MKKRKSKKALRDRLEADLNPLVQQTFESIIKRHGNSFDVSKLPIEHQTVVLVYAAHGPIGNGGFQYLFEHEPPGDPHFRLTRNAYSKIGCENAVKAFDLAFSQFPDSLPPKNMEDRIRIWQSKYNLPDAMLDKSTPDGMYFQFSKTVIPNLGKYIESNKSKFDPLNHDENASDPSGK